MSYKKKISINIDSSDNLQDIVIYKNKSNSDNDYVTNLKKKSRELEKKLDFIKKHDINIYDTDTDFNCKQNIVNIINQIENTINSIDIFVINRGNIKTKSSN